MFVSELVSKYKRAHWVLCNFQLHSASMKVHIHVMLQSWREEKASGALELAQVLEKAKLSIPVSRSYRKWEGTNPI